MNVAIRDLNDEILSSLSGKDHDLDDSRQPRAKRPTFTSTRKAPQRFNGIHRRRRKKIMW